MNYEKRYKGALEKAAIAYKDEDKHLKATLKRIFPELNESEDEKIRKELIAHFRNTRCVTEEGAEKIAKWVAWLEKQGEQKPADKIEPKFKPGDTMRTWREAANGYTDGMPVVVSIDNEYYHCINELIAIKDQDDYEFPPINVKQKSSDEVEPKFHEGEWITNGDYTWKIVDVKPLDYILQSQDGNIVDDNISYVDKHFHLWAIQDAKDGDGDVLAWDYSKCIAIFKEIYDKESFCSHGFVGACSGTFEARTGYHNIEGAHPATKEQCDLLFEKMKDANFDWDAEKKEVNKIEQKTIDIVEPKFHPGDWIVDDKTPNDVFCVIKVLEEIYKVVDTDGNDYHIPHCKADKQFHLWSRKDAKCGDVLISSLYKQPFVYNGNYTCDTLGAYFGLNHQGELLIGSSHDNNWTKLTGVKPATKEQCNILFKKLYDSDYKWDGEKKELWHKYL